jgi:uncharacterized phage protein gp47/JayE
MLDRVRTNYPEVDTREGSLIYTAVAPCALELAIMYTELDRVLEESFAETASLEYLEKRANERGLTQNLATYAVMQGEFDVTVPIGTRFSLGGYTYVVIDSEEARLQCEAPGSEPNTVLGELTPIDTVSGLTRAVITACLTPGEDDEDVEVFRSRYFESMGTYSYGFNIQQYKEVVNAMDGVAASKIIPAWNGGGTVKVIVLDSTYRTPSSSLVESVQNELDPIEDQGEGMGLAPIGHTVTVVGAGETPIDITCTIEYLDTYDWDIIKEDIYHAIDEYFKELAGDWEDSETIVVRISQITTALMDVIGVQDVYSVQINGASQNISISSDNIPIRGMVNGNS